MSASKQRKVRNLEIQNMGEQERQKKKAIRLDDLVPKQNVRGGRRLFFGATHTQQPNPNTKE